MEIGWAGLGWDLLFAKNRKQVNSIFYASNQILDAHLTRWSLRMPLVEGIGCYLIVHFCFLVLLCLYYNKIC